MDYWKYFEAFSDLRIHIETVYWYKAVDLLTVQDQVKLGKFVEAAREKLRHHLLCLQNLPPPLLDFQSTLIYSHVSAVQSNLSDKRISPAERPISTSKWPGSTTQAILASS